MAEIHLTKQGLYNEQKKKVAKLMSDPTKLIAIPSAPKEPKPREPREFIRNIWGSSAGVGSGDFHIYRGIRRRQMEREDYMSKMSEKEKLDADFFTKRMELERKAESETAKKRAKRMKKKARKSPSKKISKCPKENKDVKNDQILSDVTNVDE